jgi:hypothetical protein
MCPPGALSGNKLLLEDALDLEQNRTRRFARGDADRVRVERDLAPVLVEMRRDLDVSLEVACPVRDGRSA